MLLKYTKIQADIAVQDIESVHKAEITDPFDIDLRTSSQSSMKKTHVDACVILWALFTTSILLGFSLFIFFSPNKLKNMIGGKESPCENETFKGLRLPFFSNVTHINDSDRFEESVIEHRLSALWRPLTRPVKTFSFVHIPKAGGYSFQQDVSAFLHHHFAYSEFCFYKQWKTGGFHTSMFREPRTHVYSQFLECKYDSWGKQRTKPYSLFPKDDNMVDGMVKWVDYFLEADRGNNLFGCYDPWNMQTRMMTCQGEYMHQINPQAKKQHVVHSNMGIKEPRVDIAIRNVQNLDFFGVVEYYSESMCALYYLTKNQTIKPKCLCTGKEQPQWHHEVHHVPKHSINDLPNSTLQKIDIMTKRDKELYHFVLEQFYLNMKKLRDEGKEFICKDKLEQIERRLGMG